MEKENKKVMDDAKKERNEEIRALVLHVKRRDPRCIAQVNCWSQDDTCFKTL